MIQFSPPVASHTVDCVVFGFEDKKLKVLLIKRASEPAADEWAIPSGFMEIHETLEEAAERLLDHLTGVNHVYLEQIGTYSNLDRYPMGRVVTTAYFGLVRPQNYWLNPTWHAKEAMWCDVQEVPTLAFDHNKIIKKALFVLQRELKLSPIGFELLLPKFTLSEMQILYECVLDEKLDKRNFRRKIESMDILIQMDDVRKGSHVDAKLYAFNKKEYERKLKDGFRFEV
jgi:8-oxo-dGTP diphosphatase